MSIRKTLLSLATVALFSNSSWAGTASVPLVISGEVIAPTSISTAPVLLGRHSAEEFNSGPKYQAIFTVKVGSGIAYNFCPDTPNIAWTYASGSATNLNSNGSALIRTFKDDGVTPITPTSCWQRTGTGNFETITMLIAVNILDEASAMGLLSQTLTATVY